MHTSQATQGRCGSGRRALSLKNKTLDGVHHTPLGRLSELGCSTRGEAPAPRGANSLENEFNIKASFSKLVLRHWTNPKLLVAILSVEKFGRNRPMEVGHSTPDTHPNTVWLSVT